VFVLFGVFPIKLEFSEPFDISLVPRGHLVYMKIYISPLFWKTSPHYSFFLCLLGRNRQTPERAVEIEPRSHVVTKES